jgi:hypothetical protein
MPLVAAGLGVLGGVGGAFVGGYLANEGQESRFETERVAAIQDRRIETYGTFLGTAREVLGTILAQRSREDEAEVFVRLFSAEARVALIAESAEVENAARAVREAATADSGGESEDELQEQYEARIDDFLDAAREEIEATGP